MRKIIVELEKSEPGRVDTFKEKAKEAAAKIFDSWSEYKFFLGENVGEGGMVVLLMYKDETPFMYFWKDGLEEEKVVGTVASMYYTCLTLYVYLCCFQSID